MEGRSETPAAVKRKVRVMTQGVFDLLHVGHLHYFQKARALGDELVVVIARDKTVGRQKHKPIMAEDARLELIANLKPVDRAILGDEHDPYKSVQDLKPDIIAIGYDQPYDPAIIQRECAKRGPTVEVVRIGHYDSDLYGTRKIIRRIGDLIANKELYPKEMEKLEKVLPPEQPATARNPKELFKEEEERKKRAAEAQK
jgi:FAD synthetase